MQRAISVIQHRNGAEIAGRIALDHGERHLRRKVLTLADGTTQVLVDLAEPTHLANRDCLVLDDGRLVEIIAADENVYEVRADSPRALSVLAWHIGNRHLPAQIDGDRILIAEDQVIHTMLLGLGATVDRKCAPFQPERGAYHGHAKTEPRGDHHDHKHGHGHGHGHGHHHHPVSHD